MQNSEIKVQNLYVKLSESFGLKDINFEFKQGKVYALLGESGSGKSTLLRAITGLLPVDRGDILVDELPVQEGNLKLLSQKVGFMPQHYGLFPHLTVKQNVCLQAKLLGWSKERIETRLQQMMDLVLLPKHHLSKYPSQMSGGQKQRIALMRCMFLDQPIFLFDEPLSALDMKTKTEILNEWNQLFSKLKKLVILVTHSLEEAKALGGEILVMRKGEIKESGSYQELSSNPQSLLAREFLSC